MASTIDPHFANKGGISMVPFIPILAWAGGVAAGAKLASGMVRSAKALVHGQPGAALVELAGAVAAPVQMAGEELRHLGKEIVGAVLGVRHDGLEDREAADAVLPFVQRQSRRSRATAIKVPPPNGELMSADS